MNGTLLAVDPSRIFIGHAGAHRGRVCILDSNVVRLATRAEIALARLSSPVVRAMIDRAQQDSPKPDDAA